MTSKNYAVESSAACFATEWTKISGNTAQFYVTSQYAKIAAPYYVNGDTAYKMAEKVWDPPSTIVSRRDYSAQFDFALVHAYGQYAVGETVFGVGYKHATDNTYTIVGVHSIKPANATYNWNIYYGYFEVALDSWYVSTLASGGNYANSLDTLKSLVIKINQCKTVHNGYNYTKMKYQISVDGADKSGWLYAETYNDVTRIPGISLVNGLEFFYLEHSTNTDADVGGLYLYKMVSK